MGSKNGKKSGAVTKRRLTWVIERAGLTCQRVSTCVASARVNAYRGPPASARLRLASGPSQKPVSPSGWWRWS